MTTGWRWTDDDSRDLDERTRRMRRPKRYVPPISTKEAEQVAKHPVTTLDQFVSRPSRRKTPTSQQKQAQEWARTRAQLERAGIRPVESPPATKLAPAPKARKRASKAVPTPRPPRYCANDECGVDISHRGAMSVHCEECAYKHARQRKRAEYAARTRTRKENTK